MLLLGIGWAEAGSASNLLECSCPCQNSSSFTLDRRSISMIQLNTVTLSQAVAWRRSGPCNPENTFATTCRGRMMLKKFFLPSSVTHCVRSSQGLVWKLHGEVIFSSCLQSAWKIIHRIRLHCWKCPRASQVRCDCRQCVLRFAARPLPTAQGCGVVWWWWWLCGGGGAHVAFTHACLSRRMYTCS